MEKLNYTKLKIGNYCRKSSEGEDRQALSIQSQIDEGAEILKYNKLPNLTEVFTEAKSAKTEYLRPEFSRLKTMIDAGKIDSIVCWKLDRLARNMTEGGMIIDYLSSGKIKAIFTKDRVWLPTDNVILMAVDFSQGTQYSKDLSANVKRGQRTKAKNGLPSGLATLGFLNSKEGDKGERWWYVDNVRFTKIKKLFELFLTGTYSVGKLHKYAIQDLHLDTPKHKKLGGGLITRANIYKMLKNPIYAGFFFKQECKYHLDKNLPTIINENQYDLINKILSNKSKPKSQTHKATYSGFIKSPTGDFIGQDFKFQLTCDCKLKFCYRSKTNCPKCGVRITDMINPKYENREYYYNVRKKKAQLDYISLPETDVTNFINNFIETNLVLPVALLDWSKKYVAELKDKEIDEKLSSVKDNQNRTEEFERKKMKTREMLRNEIISDEEYKSDIGMLETQYKDLKENNIKTVDWSLKLNEIIDLSSDMKELMKNGSYEAKRNQLSKLGSHFIWDDKILSINNTKSVNTFINGIKTIRPYFDEFSLSKNLDNKGDLGEDALLCIRLRKW